MSSAHGHDDHGNWHHHDPSEGLPQEEHGTQVNAAALGRGLALIIVTTLGLVGVTLLYFNHTFQQLRLARTNTDISQGYWEYRNAAKARIEGNGPDGKPTLEAAREAVIAKYKAVK